MNLWIFFEAACAEADACRSLTAITLIRQLNNPILGAVDFPSGPKTFLPMKNTSRCGFTLLEMLLAVFIAVMVITVAVPSVSGVLAEQRMKRSFEAFNRFVRKAQEFSMKERMTYRIRFETRSIALEPADVGGISEAENPPDMVLPLKRDERLDLRLPAALIPDPPAEWTFWPNGTCEPAVVTYHGPNGDWQAAYDPLTGIPEFRTDI